MQQDEMPEVIMDGLIVADRLTLNLRHVIYSVIIAMLYGCGGFTVSAAEPEVLPTTVLSTSQCNRFGGDVWELSTRHIQCVNKQSIDSPNTFQVYRTVPGGWSPSTIDEALYRSSSSAPAVRTILYVHGNWMERDNARNRVQIIDRYIARRATESYRLVMLSWPSEKNEPILRDVKSNAILADAESIYVNWILSVLSESSTNVSLLGFSLGAKSVIGGLNLDASNPRPHTPYRVTLVAPAVDRNWLQPGGRHSAAMTHTEKLVNLYNSRDPVLRRFRFLDSTSRPIAAGFAGFGAIANPRSSSPLNSHDRIVQYDCGGHIGNTHDEKTYYGECPYFAMAVDNLLGK